VTRAQLSVRNSRRQFLRLELPPQSEIWSVFVDGRAEKPARAGDSENAVLIKMINSTSGFPVEIVYATEGAPMAMIGTLSGRLPRPDMIVTHTRWDVFLPAAFRYRKPAGTLDIVMAGRSVDPSTLTDIGQSGNERIQGGQPLRISVPTQGIQFSFEKLYANQAPEDAGFTIAYIPAEIAQFGWIASIAGVLLIWLGIFGLGSNRMARALAITCVALGGLLVLGSIVYLESDPTLAAALTLAIALLAGLVFLVRRWLDWRKDHLPQAYE
jgi:hypothetical protein